MVRLLRRSLQMHLDGHTPYAGEDLIGSLAEHAVAENDGILARDGRVDQCGHDGAGGCAVCPLRSKLPIRTTSSKM
jgi:hypothetical protein